MDISKISWPKLSSKPSILGLNVEGESILQIAHIVMNGTTPVVKELITIDLEKNDGEEIKAFKKKHFADLFVTALDSAATLVRPLKIPLLKQKDIAAALPFQVEPLLPYPIDEALLDTIILSKSDDSTNVIVVAVQKEKVISHIELWQSFGIEPEIITSLPAALATLSHFIAPEAPLHFILYIGDTETICVLARAGQLLAAQTFLDGIDKFKISYQNDLLSKTAAKSFEEIDFSQIDAKEFPQLFDAVMRWQKQTLRTLLAMAKQGRGEAVQAALCLGKGAELSHLTDKLLANLNVSAVKEEEWAINENKEGYKKFILPIAIALTQTVDVKNSLNFRQSELVYPNRWRRVKKELTIFVSLALLLALALFFAYNAYLKKLDAQLRSEYATVLAATHKNYTDVEKDVEQRQNGGRKVPDNFVPLEIDKLTPEHISYRLSLISKELQNIPELFPLQPGVPRVADLLAWLATHPNVAIASDEGEKASRDTLQIESLSYSMMKRPQNSHPQEHYQVKVEIEFTSPTSKQARAFHDALIAPNEMVDPKAEVKWNANQGHYRTSFFLKDKTIYSTQAKK